jgi:putative membrane protein
MTEAGKPMALAATVLVVSVAILHFGFLVLEIFFWRKPLGHRVFGLPPEVMSASAPLAANQGLYNGFLAAGLLWGTWLGAAGYPERVFFLICVVVAGVFGAATAKRSILWIQAFPGALALAFTLLAPR